MWKKPRYKLTNLVITTIFCQSPRPSLYRGCTVLNFTYLFLQKWGAGWPRQPLPLRNPDPTEYQIFVSFLLAFSFFFFLLFSSTRCAGCQVVTWVPNRINTDGNYKVFKLICYFPLKGTIKTGVVQDDDLKRLSLKLNDSWRAVARRLGFKEAEMRSFRGLHVPPLDITRTEAKEQLNMLGEWKRRRRSKATYKVLYNALCHESVKREDLAAGFCIRTNHADESSAYFNSSSWVGCQLLLLHY